MGERGWGVPDIYADSGLDNSRVIIKGITLQIQVHLPFEVSLILNSGLNGIKE